MLLWGGGGGGGGGVNCWGQKRLSQNQRLKVTSLCESFLNKLSTKVLGAKDSRELDHGIRRAVQLAERASWIKIPIQLARLASWNERTIQLARSASRTNSSRRGLDLMPFTEPRRINPSFRIDRIYHWSFTIRTAKTHFPE